MLKIYAWEHKTFPESYDIYLLPQSRERVIKELAKFFGIQVDHIEFSTYRNGIAQANRKTIKLPRKACSLGLAVHELAHLYNYQKNNGERGHRKAFKQALIKLMVETKYELPRLLNRNTY